MEEWIHRRKSHPMVYLFISYLSGSLFSGLIQQLTILILTIFLLFILLQLGNRYNIGLKPFSFLSIIFLFASVGALNQHVWLRDLPASLTYKQEHVRIKAEILDFPEERQSNIRLKVKEFSENRQAQHWIVYINKSEKKEQYRPGSIVQILGTAYPIPAAISTAEFDYRMFLQRQSFVGKIYAHQITLTSIKPSKNILYTCLEWRNKLIGIFYSYIKSKPIAALMAALLFGDRTGIDNELTKAFTDTGTIHILAVSGMHVGLIAMIINLLMKPLQKLKPQLLNVSFKYKKSFYY
jgi:predicted membrane metal-binding protein